MGLMCMTGFLILWKSLQLMIVLTLYCLPCTALVLLQVYPYDAHPAALLISKVKNSGNLTF